MMFNTAKHLFLGLGLMISCTTLFGAAQEEEMMTAAQARAEIVSLIKNELFLGASLGMSTSLFFECCTNNPKTLAGVVSLVSFGYHMNKFSTILRSEGITDAFIEEIINSINAGNMIPRNTVNRYLAYMKNLIGISIIPGSAILTILVCETIKKLLIIE